MVGGAWPFLVGGAICLVNSDNERDFGLLISLPILCARAGLDFSCLLEGWWSRGPAGTAWCLLLRGTSGAASRTKLSNNRSVMPLDVRGRTCATMTVPASMETWPERVGQTFHHRRDWDRGLQLFPVNEEFLVSASHKLALITSLPFVHTARRYYRLNG